MGLGSGLPPSQPTRELEGALWGLQGKRRKQARRGPQKGPGHHHRGAYHNLILYAPRSKRGEGCPLTIRLGVWGVS